MRASVRNSRGSQIVEFAAALVLIVCFVVLPVLDIAILLGRWMVANEIVVAATRDLALCETFSQSHKDMNEPNFVLNRLAHLGGVKTESADLFLRIGSNNGASGAEDVVIVRQPGRIPDPWLPNGAKTPSSYTLVLRVNLLLSPPMMLTGVALSIPGVTRPIPIAISSLHKWENLGRNPASGEFFVNE